MKDDYLFDPDATPDPEIVRLERALEKFRHGAERTPSSSPNPPPRRHPLRWLSSVAVAAAVVVAAFLWLDHGSSTIDSPYRLDTASVGTRVWTKDGREREVREGVLAGDRIEIDENARARLSIGSIGSVVLEANSSVRVEDRGTSELDSSPAFGLFLERGTVAASIFAAPRVFQVGTPAGIAVDLGCIYKTTVTDDGRTWLSVVSGFVSFETKQRHVLVPAGAECEALPGTGPLTPTWQDAPHDYKDAIRRIDLESPVPEDALAALHAQTDRHATLTLWHLLTHAERTVRKTALDVLVSAGHVPDSIGLDRLMDGDADALLALRESFDWGP